MASRIALRKSIFGIFGLCFCPQVVILTIEVRWFEVNDRTSMIEEVPILKQYRIYEFTIYDHRLMMSYAIILVHINLI